MIALLILALCYSIVYCFLPKAFWKDYVNDADNFFYKGLFLLALIVVMLPFLKSHVVSCVLGYCMCDPISCYFLVWRPRNRKLQKVEQNKP